MNISLKEFREMLIRHGLVDSDAIDGSERYDFGITLDKTLRVWAECVAVSKLREIDANNKGGAE